MSAERILRVAAACTALLAGAGALFTSDDIEVTLLMVAAVCSGLVCFDVCMARRLQAFGPWVLLTLAPVLKTVPEVWLQLRSESDVLAERFEHSGSLFFGICVLGAVALLARPADSLGPSVRGFDGGVIAGTAVIGALAGSSVAFLFDSGFGSPAIARLLETSTWFVVTGIIAAAVVAASHAQVVSVSLGGVLATSATTSAVLALSIAGRSFDRGWWALLFAALAVSAVAGGGEVGLRSGRDRRSTAPVVVALIAGLIAAASAVAARSDRTAWSPGWALLGLAALAMFGLAMASKPLEEQGSPATPTGPVDIGFDDDYRARRARSRAINALESGDNLEPATTVKPPTTSPRVINVPKTRETGVPPQTQSTHSSTSLPAPAPAPAPIPLPAPEPVAAPVTAKPQAPAPAPAPGPEPHAPQTSEVAAREPLSDGNVVAAAQAAAAVRNAPKAQRHSLAPLGQAHHFDPSTGLLSSAGLQHAIGRAFDVPRRAGHITMLMFLIRDLDRIEQEHGRLAAAAVTREVAERVNTLLPNGSGARFSRAAYAVILVGDRSNTHETTQWLARVLLELRAPVEGGSLGDKIDVVAGMAQCYESEDAASFVQRANSGLARAAQLAEPTLVAMP